MKDPTASKPLWVALQIRRDVQRLGKEGMLNAQQVAALGNNQIPDLIEMYTAMNKVDKMVLPLPYSQLLKLFSIFYVFSVPFVLAPDVGFLTPFITVFLAMGYFGLDQLGAELECPFGKDPNDIPMLTVGSDLCRNLDTLMRLVMREVKESRQQQQPSHLPALNHPAAAPALSAAPASRPKQIPGSFKRPMSLDQALSQGRDHLSRVSFDADGAEKEDGDKEGDEDAYASRFAA
jgi:hypothetical protein